MPACIECALHVAPLVVHQHAALARHRQRMLHRAIGISVGLEDAAVRGVEDGVEVAQEGQLLPEVRAIEQVELIGQDGHTVACGARMRDGLQRLGPEAAVGDVARVHGLAG